MRRGCVDYTAGGDTAQGQIGFFFFWQTQRGGNESHSGTGADHATVIYPPIAESIMERNLGNPLTPLPSPCLQQLSRTCC